MLPGLIDCHTHLVADATFGGLERAAAMPDRAGRWYERVRAVPGRLSRTSAMVFRDLDPLLSGSISTLRMHGNYYDQSAQRVAWRCTPVAHGDHPSGDQVSLALHNPAGRSTACGAGLVSLG